MLLPYEAILFVLALCLDSLTASFSFGMSKIKVPLLSAFMISFIGSLFLFLSISCGAWVRTFLSPQVSTYLFFGVLFLLGILRLWDIVIKKSIKKKNTKKQSCSTGFCHHLLTVYAECEKADTNCSQSLSVSEAITLAIALSADSLAAGIGVGVIAGSGFSLCLFALVCGFVAVEVGCFIGRRVAKITTLDLSWISGVVLIGLAILRLV